MFSIPVVVGQTPTGRNHQRTAHTVESLRAAARQLEEWSIAIGQLASNVESPEFWGEESEVDAGRHYHRAEFVSRLLADARHAQRDVEDNLLRATVFASQFEITKEA